MDKKSLKTLARSLKAGSRSRVKAKTAGKAAAPVVTREVVLKRIASLKERLARTASKAAATEKARKAPVRGTRLGKASIRRKRAQDGVAGGEPREDSVLDGGDNNISDELKDKYYGENENPTPGVNTGKDIEKQKQDALALLPDTMRPENIKESHRRAIRLVHARMTKNLEAHPLKASMYEILTGDLGFDHKTASAAIEAAWSRGAADALDTILRRADEVSEYTDETITEMAQEVQMTCEIMPVGPDEGEASEEEGSDEEMEDRLVEGSFKAPKRKASKTGSGSLGAAVPRYSLGSTS